MDAFDGCEISNFNRGLWVTLQANISSYHWQAKPRPETVSAAATTAVLAGLFFLIFYCEQFFGRRGCWIEGDVGVRNTDLIDRLFPRQRNVNQYGSVPESYGSPHSTEQRRKMHLFRINTTISSVYYPCSFLEKQARPSVGHRGKPVFLAVPAQRLLSITTTSSFVRQQALFILNHRKNNFDKVLVVVIIFSEPSLSMKAGFGARRHMRSAQPKGGPY